MREEIGLPIIPFRFRIRKLRRNLWGKKLARAIVRSETPRHALMHLPLSTAYNLTRAVTPMPTDLRRKVMISIWIGCEAGKSAPFFFLFHLPLAFAAQNGDWLSHKVRKEYFVWIRSNFPRNITSWKHIVCATYLKAATDENDRLYC